MNKPLDLSVIEQFAHPTTLDDLTKPNRRERFQAAVARCAGSGWTALPIGNVPTTLEKGNWYRATRQGRYVVAWRLFGWHIYLGDARVGNRDYDTADEAMRVADLLQLPQRPN
jgi:hypothetical protein